MTPARGPAGPVRAETLSGGLRLVTEPMADVASVALGFWVGTGSRDEPDEQAGASHFLEHLLFKGTPGRSAAAIAEALDGVGGDCNAFTTKEYTAFYVRLLAEDLTLGLDILADIMTGPALRPEEVEAERSVILDEILMHADEPADLVAERWQAAVFPDHPLGRDTLGTAGSVGDLSPEDIARFFAHHYRPANIVVAAAGDCDHDALATALADRFAGTEPGGAPSRTAPAGPSRPLAVVRRPTEQAHLLLGVRTMARDDERRFALGLLNHILGGGLSSRLFQKVREERGLAYAVWSDRALYQDAGTLAIGAGTAPGHAQEVLRIATGELEALAEAGPSAKELAVARANLRADVLLAGEDSGARMSRLGSALLLHGRVRAVPEILARIAAVEADDVRAVARELAGAPRTLAAVGPFDPEDFDLGALGLAHRAA